MADSKNYFYSFDESRESTKNYLERFNVFCYIQELKEEKRQQILLTSLSPELYSPFKELIHPKEVIKLSFKEFKDVLLQLFVKPSNVTTERYKFHRLKQQVGQPVKEYIDLVRKQAAKCKFGNFEQEACKDQMVLGVIDGALRKRFCKTMIFRLKRYSSSHSI